MPSKKIDIMQATASQLAEFAILRGLEANYRDGTDKLRAKLQTTGYNYDFIELEDAEPPIARVDPPAPAGSKRMVRLIIAKEVGGPDPVYTSVNGVPFWIPRGKECEVPYKYYEALMHAVASVPITDEDSKITGWEEVPQYPVSTLRIDPEVKAEPVAA